VEYDLEPDGTARIVLGDGEPHDELADVVVRLRDAGATRVTVAVEEGDDRRLAALARLGFVAVERVLSVELEVLGRDLERRPRGPSFGSIHVQTDDVPAVERGVRRFVPLLPGRSQGSVVSQPRNGWVAVYDELADRDPSALKRLARELSDRLGLPTISFGVEEGAVARFLLYDRGRLLDEYLSVQEYYGPLPSGEVVALAANATLISRLTGASRDAVRAAAVHGRTPDEIPPAPEIVAALARAMRIDGAEHGYAAATELTDAVHVGR
jgi:hypothetical protein